jgi:hypothetical protein
LATWLQQCQIENVVLESTGVSWITLCAVLEERGFEVKLVGLDHGVGHFVEMTSQKRLQSGNSLAIFSHDIHA